MTTISYRKVPFWNGKGYLLSIPRSIYPAISKILYTTMVQLGEYSHIRADKTKNGWIVYKHVADEWGAHAGDITVEELNRYLDKVAKKYNNWKQKTTLDEWLEVKA